MTARAFAGSMLSLFVLSACGGTTTTPSTDETSGAEACQARADADSLADALTACREAQAEQEAWPAQASYDAVLDLVRAHLASLSEPREVTSEETQPVADAIWAFLDELTFPAQNEGLRTSAEEAAEGLLRDRDRDHAPAAAQAAFEAITSIRATLHPIGLDPCADLAASADDARTHAGQVCND
jgi:hypothetical protein